MHSLSRDECSQYDRRIEQVLKETLAAFACCDASRMNPIEWKFLARRDQISAYRVVSATRHEFGSYKRRVVASGFLPTGIHDIINVLYVEDDKDFLTTQAILNPDGYTALDAAVLTITEQRQSHRSPLRFTGVKWYSWSHTVNLSKKEKQWCDLLTYERMGMIPLDAKDGELIYHVMLSVNKPEWPLNRKQDAHRPRADSTFCFLFRRVCDDLVECFALVDYYHRSCGTLSERPSHTEMANRVLTISRFPTCARAKVLSKFVHKARGRPVLLSKVCVRCGWRRKLLEPLRNCCICKNAVCHKCSESKTIFSLHANTRRPERNTFCQKCLGRIKTRTAKKRAILHQLQAARGGSSMREEDSNEKQDTSWETETEIGRYGSVRANESHAPNYDKLFQKYAIHCKPRELRTVEERDGNLLSRMEAERAFHSFLERRKRLAYLEDKHEAPFELLSGQKTTRHSTASDNLPGSTPIRSSKVFASAALDNQVTDPSERRSDVRRSQFPRDSKQRTCPNESKDIFRKDLYGHF